jgi:N-acetylglucosamine kinase-like BadF-type ATPase
VYGPGARSRGELAQLSPLVAKAANLGDVAALDIFRRAGQELAQIAIALRLKLGYEAEEPVKLSYSGGALPRAKCC